MKQWVSRLIAVALCVGPAVVLVSQQPSSAPPKPMVVNINAQQTAQPLSNYQFGMLIEHIGPLVYRSLWSEMLDDRKFYFPITSKPDDANVHPAGGGFHAMQLRKWRPVGPDEVVVMDKDQPFVGEQSPRIDLDTSTPHGIRQTGLAVVKASATSVTSDFAELPAAKSRLH